MGVYIKCFLKDHCLEKIYYPRYMWSIQTNAYKKMLPAQKAITIGHVYDSSAVMMTIIASVIEFDMSFGHNENGFLMETAAFGKFSHYPHTFIEHSIIYFFLKSRQKPESKKHSNSNRISQDDTVFFYNEMERFPDNCLKTPISIIFLSFTELQYNDVCTLLQWGPPHGFGSNEDDYYLIMVGIHKFLQFAIILGNWGSIGSIRCDSKFLEDLSK